MDYLWSAYHEPLGSNLFQKVHDFGGPVPPPITGIFLIAENGDYLTDENDEFYVTNE